MKSMKFENRSDLLREVRTMNLRLRRNIEKIKKEDLPLSINRIKEYENAMSRVPNINNINMYSKMTDSELTDLYRDLTRLVNSGKYSSKDIRHRVNEYDKYLKAIQYEGSSLSSSTYEANAYGILDLIYDKVGVIMDKKQKYETVEVIQELMYNKGTTVKDIIRDVSDIYENVYGGDGDYGRANRTDIYSYELDNLLGRKKYPWGIT